MGNGSRFPIRRTVLGLGASLVIAATATATPRQNMSVPNASFDPVLDGPEGMPPFSGIPTSETGSPTRTCSYIVVQRNVAITASWRQGFVDRGAEILAVFPIRALLMRVPPGFDPVNGDATIRWPGQYRPAYKVHAALANALLGTDVTGLLNGNGKLPIAVIIHRGESLPDVELQVQAAAPSATIVGLVSPNPVGSDGAINRVLIELPPADAIVAIPLLARLQAASYLDLWGTPEFGLDESVWYTQTSIPPSSVIAPPWDSSTWHYDITAKLFAHGVSGRGQIIADLDQGRGIVKCCGSRRRDQAAVLRPFAVFT